MSVGQKRLQHSPCRALLQKECQSALEQDNETFVPKHLFLCLVPQSMAAGASGASGHCAVRAARGSAAEIARLRSPNMEDGCVTGWQWRQTTAPAASAHRVGDVGLLSPLVWQLEKDCLASSLSGPSCSGDCVIIDRLFIISGSVGKITIVIRIVLITGTPSYIFIILPSPHT